MKKIITWVVVVSVVLGGIYTWFRAMEHGEVRYVAGETIEKEVIKEVNPLDEQIKQREAELTEKYENIKRLEARRDVLQAERDRLDAELTSVTKELASFMTGTQ